MSWVGQYLSFICPQTNLDPFNSHIKKLILCYTRFNILSGARVIGAQLRGFTPGSARMHIKVATVASRLQRVGDLIGSGFEPHTSRTRSRRITTCTIWSVNSYLHSIAILSAKS